MRRKCHILPGTERVAYDTVVQLNCDARVQSEKQGILRIEVVEIFTGRVSHLAEMTTPLPRGIPNSSHDRHLLEHKRKVCQLVTMCRHIVVVSAVGRVSEPPATATNVLVHEMFLHLADAAHVQVTEKGNPASCSTEPPASCAPSLCSRCTSACHVLASSYVDLLAKTRWPLCGAPHAPSVPPTEA